MGRLRKNRLLMLAMIFALFNLISIANVVAQSATVYGMSYQDGLNTIDARNRGGNALVGIGYSPTNGYYDRWDVTTDNCFPGDTLNRMKTDNVFFFVGHGNTGRMIFVSSQNGANTISAQNGPNSITSLSYADIHDIAFALLESCLSANTDSTYGNLQIELNNRGVDSSIGFNAILNYPQVVCWNDGFWFNATMSNRPISTCGHDGDSRVSYYFPNNPGGTNGWNVRGDRLQTISPSQSGD